MSAITERGGREYGDLDFDRLLAWRPRVSLELVAVGLLFLIGAALRFYDLGNNAMHHDESLHGVYSWRFFTGQGYVHDPLMHGPFLFHAMALVYGLFGVSEATARFVPVIFGAALILLPLLLRRRLGAVGTVAAAALLAFSPSLFYFSRFVGAGGQDMVLVVCALLMAGGVWRYLDEGRARWLFLIAGALSVSFATKEVTFITAVIFIVWLNGLTAYHLAERWGEGGARRLLAAVALFPLAWLLAALWAIVPELGRTFRRERLPRAADALLALGLLTAPQFAAAIQAPLERLGYDMGALSRVGDWTNERLFGWLTVLTLVAATTALGLAWRRRDFAICAAIFWSIYVVLFTSVFTNREGLATGIWGSLDYWMAQHGELRGAQPVNYYAVLTSIYEYLALLLGLAGVIAAAARGGRWTLAALGGAAVALLLGVIYGDGGGRTLPFAVLSVVLLMLALRGDAFRSFFAFWFAATFFGLSVAGEKMPWLETHLALPLALLAALTLRDVARAWPAAWRGAAAREPRRWWPVALAAGAGLLLAATLLLADDTARWTPLIVLLLAVIAGAAVAGLRRGRGALAAVLAAGAVAVLGPLTVRDAWRATFTNADTPRDMLIYTQTTPRLAEMAARVEELARTSGKGKELRIMVDDQDAFTWPWAWYLRDYKNTTFVNMSQFRDNPSLINSYPTPDLLLVNNANAWVADYAYPGQFGPGIPYPHRWWFPEEGYRAANAGRFWQSVRDPEMWGLWANFVLHRELVYPIGSVNAVAYFPPDFAPAESAPAAAASFAPRLVDNRLVVGGPGTSSGAFNRPAGLALDRDGFLYIADSNNKRVQKLAPDGAFVAQSNPALRLNEPWGVAVGDDGFVYVADTWNHRIVKLDRNLAFVSAWGGPNPSGDARAATPLELYGPRDIALDRAGNLWVTDTGHGRVLKFSPDGQPLGQFGRTGTGPGEFQEPVSIAAAPNGEFFVADAWNGRVQRFDADFKPLGAFEVSGWGSRDVEQKPYLRVTADGRIVVGLPEQGRVEVYTPEGQRTGGWREFGDSPLGARPLGLALDPTGALWVADALAAEVVRITWR